MEFSANEFRQAEGENASQALFKIAAQEQINNCNQQVAQSLKYQVLCDQTAMIGVVKQKEKATGEIKQFEQTIERFKEEVRRP